MPRKEIIDRIEKYVRPFRITKGNGFKLADFGADALTHICTLQRLLFSRQPASVGISEHPTDSEPTTERADTDVPANSGRELAMFSQSAGGDRG
jgi:hypothetical protein